MNDGDQLKQVQRQTAYEQINSTWVRIIKYPKAIIIWIMFVMLIATLGNTVRLHFVMKDMTSIVNSSNLDKERSTRKVRQAAETIKILQGCLLDNPGSYIEAENVNEFRRQGFYGEPHKFTFDRWNKRARAKIINVCIAEHKYNSLEFFTKQDGWDRVCPKQREAVSTLLANKINEGKFWWSTNKDFRELTKDEREKVRYCWQKHRAVFHSLSDK
jgi:hypothetical protein